MKNLFTILAACAVVLFSSCDKQDLPTPASTTVPATTVNHVEYRVTSVTGHVNVTYNTYEDGALVTKTSDVNRTVFNYYFDAAPNSSLSIKAHNQLPTAQEVHVEIYLNDVLVKEGYAETPGGNAVAEIVK